MLIFIIGFVIGGVLVAGIGKILSAKKNKNFIRRGLYCGLYCDYEFTNKSGGIVVDFEVGEIESTDDKSKVKVISAKTSLVRRRSRAQFPPKAQLIFCSKSLRQISKAIEMVDNSWILQSDIEWIVESKSQIRNSKIEEILK